MDNELGSKRVLLQQLNSEDLEKYHSFLKTQSLKSNTRRRMLMTIRNFFRYLNNRKNISINIGSRLPTPYKIERIPKTVSYKNLLTSIKNMSMNSDISSRDRVLLWTLLETACQVSELKTIRTEDWSADGLHFNTKRARKVPISNELFEATQIIQHKYPKKGWFFYSFNRFGPMKTPITSRGVELLVRHHSKELGFKNLTPRMIRHSTVHHWLNENISTKEIQQRLGLKSEYSFRIYNRLQKTNTGDNKYGRST